VIQLRKYQEEAVETLAHCLREKHCAVDLSDTGLGKTMHALGTVARFAPVPFIVICRAVSRHKWEKAVRDFGLQHLCVAVDSYQKFTSGRHYKNIVTKNKGRGVSYEWHPEETTIVIFDECQDAGGLTSLNSQLLIGTGKCHNTYPLCLSATVADSPLKLKALGFLTRMHSLTDYYPWCLRNGCGKSPFGYNNLYFRNSDRKRVVTSLHHHLKDYGVRVKREEVMEYMPEETVEIELWDIGSRPKAGPVFEALQKLEETRDEDLLRHEDAVPGAVELMRDRQEAELLKLSALAREITSAVADGLYVPVFLNFVDSIDVLQRLLQSEGVTAGIFDGRNTRTRDETLQDFMEARLQCIILQSQAGSAAIDLHDTEGGRPRCTFVCPTYHAETMIQMLGRAVRFGAKSPVFQRICFAEGTVEERVYRVAETKCENIRAMNDGEWVNAFN
jgi:superfamily II DNA or RNA helicase